MPPLNFLNRFLISELKTAGDATVDFYLANTPSDGFTLWDTGSTGLNNENYLNRPAIRHGIEPVD